MMMPRIRPVLASSFWALWMIIEANLLVVRALEHMHLRPVAILVDVPGRYSMRI